MAELTFLYDVEDGKLPLFQWRPQAELGGYLVYDVINHGTASDHRGNLGCSRNDHNLALCTATMLCLKEHQGKIYNI